MNGSSRVRLRCRRDIGVEDLVDHQNARADSLRRLPPETTASRCSSCINGARRRLPTWAPIQSLGSQRETSRQRRGCPSGLVLSQRISRKLVSLTMSSTRSLMVISCWCQDSLGLVHQEPRWPAPRPRPRLPRTGILVKPIRCPTNVVLTRIAGLRSGSGRMTWLV